MGFCPVHDMSSAVPKPAGANRLELDAAGAERTVRVRRVEAELDFLRQLHLQSILQADRSQGLSESLLKQIASYFRLVNTQIRIWVWLDRRMEVEGMAAGPLAELWEVLLQIPALGGVLSRREVQEQILAKLSGREMEEMTDPSGTGLQE